MSDSALPQYSEEAFLGDMGKRIVDGIVHDQLGWLFRPTGPNDLGIDGQIEILRDRRSQGRLIAVQIKCGHSYLKTTVDEGYVYYGDVTHLNYWTSFSLPVLVILCNPDTREAYWAQVCPANIQHTEMGWKTIVPFIQRFDGNAKPHLDILEKAPQARDLIELGLYRLVIEKFPGIKIAQVFEEPEDYHWFPYLGKIGEELVQIAFLYRPVEACFTIADVEEVLHWADHNKKVCGANRVFLFFCAVRDSQAKLDRQVVEFLRAYPQLTWFRLMCSTEGHVSVYELDEADQPVWYYP